MNMAAATLQHHSNTMLSILPFLIATRAIPRIFAWQEQCQGFKADSIANVKDLTTVYHPAGSFVNVTSPWSTLTTTELPAFCRLKFNVLTNPETGKTAGSELWLRDDWNTRMLAFGGGGWSGGGEWKKSHTAHLQELTMIIPA